MTHSQNIVAFAAVVFSATACAGQDESNDIETTQVDLRDETLATRSSEEFIAPISCSSRPWTMESRPCGERIRVHGRQITCDDLDLPGGGTDVTLDSFEYDNGFRWRDFSVDPGYTTKVYTNSNRRPPERNEWGITSFVLPDASTRTVDAIIFTGRRGEGSLVVRFDPPEFYVRDMTEPFVTQRIQLCGYRPGAAAEPPPG